ncbi:hypothetical protein EAF00_011573 [Botryotinia globosa]|nr:hypothetical protein EAF00_011573 [Botryotinia globosa]
MALERYMINRLKCVQMYAIQDSLLFVMGRSLKKCHVEACRLRQNQIFHRVHRYRVPTTWASQHPSGEGFLSSIDDLKNRTLVYLSHWQANRRFKDGKGETTERPTRQTRRTGPAEVIPKCIIFGRPRAQVPTNLGGNSALSYRVL